jgi:hypothetical protein
MLRALLSTLLLVHTVAHAYTLLLLLYTQTGAVPHAPVYQ